MRWWSQNLGVWGLRLEVFGLVVALSATLLQGAVTDWFAQNRTESQYYIQEMVNLSVLNSLANISDAAGAEDARTRKDILERVHEQAQKTINDIIGERDEERRLEKGQAHVFRTTWFALLLLGAFLITAGTYCELRNKQASSRDKNVASG
jgi:hypothetical protein